MDIVTPAEFAAYLRVSLASILDRLDLLELAQGLVVDEVGVLDPWPATARAVVLAAAGRAYSNPDGVKQSTVGGVTDVFLGSEAGVYLTADERARLHRATTGGDTAGPQGAFPDACAWPDPARG